MIFNFIKKFKIPRRDLVFGQIVIKKTFHQIFFWINLFYIYPNLANKYDLDLIPFLLEGVALKPEFNQDDGMHPNEKGTLIISSTLKNTILNFIKK